jgi:hypothetical protein
MGKMTWIIVAVLLFLLFRDKIGAAADSITRAARPSDYYNGALPAPNYYSSAPTSRSATVTDVINNLITAGTSIYRGVQSNSPAAPGDSSGFGGDWSTLQNAD